MNEEYVKMTMERWKPILALNLASKLTEHQKNCLSVLLENAEREIEDRKVKPIFIPLTVDVFLGIADKIENMVAMTAPVDKTEDGKVLTAHSRKLAAFKVELEEITTGIDADAELVKGMSGHICSEILRGVKDKKLFAPYILVFPKLYDMTVLYTRYAIL